MNQLELNNRLQKRWKYLSKWAGKNNIEYFRLYDRDIFQGPYIIDRMPEHWLVWVCDHAMETTEFSAQLNELSSILQTLAKGTVCLIDRTKEKRLALEEVSYSDVIINEGGLKFLIKPGQYLDTGLFIDHRLLRQYIKEVSAGKRVLNLFSYTGSVSCYAIAGGAQFTKSVDINPVYCEWHQKNCDLNQFKKDQYAIVTRDCRKFLWENKEKFDIIFCDPPSFSQTKRNHLGHFQVQEHAGEIIQQCLSRLSDGGQLIFSTNYRKFKLEQALDTSSLTIKELTNRFCSKDFDGSNHRWAARCWQIRPTEQ